MENFQSQMNNDKSVERWGRWENHRNVVKGLFDEVFNLKDKVGSVGIIGAGNCDDLDLEYIGVKCDKIILFDIDYQSMYRAVEKLDSSTKEKIDLVKVDITNINFDEFTSRFEELIISKVKPKKVIKFLVESANNLKANNEVMANYYKSCDIVACSAIYSQLFYNWAIIKLDKLGSYSDSEYLNIVSDGLVYFRDKTVRVCNNELLNIAKPNSGVVVWADLFEMEDADLDVIKLNDLNSANPLIWKKGLQASLLGIKDVHANLEKFIVLRDWIWDFEEEKKYYCRGLSGILK